jgi:hypothetical protein
VRTITKAKRIAGALLAGALLAGAVPAPALADHDCGPPPKHSDHKFDQGDRKKPCK